MPNQTLTGFFALRPFSALLLLVVMTAAFGTSSAEAQAVRDTVRLDLEAAINRSIDVSPEIAAVSARRDFARARHDFAQANRFLTNIRLTTLHTLAPGLTDGSGLQPSDRLYLDPSVRNDWERLRPFNRIEVDAQQPLFTWGELGGSIRAAREAVHVEGAGIRRTEAELALRTAELYQGMLLARSLQRLTSDAENVLQTARRELERLLDDGDPSVDDADLFKLEITEQEFISRVVEVDEQLATAESALRRQLMLPENSVVVPEDDRLVMLATSVDSLPTLIAAGQQLSPLINQADAGIAARSELLTVARSNYYPTIFVAATGAFAYAHGRHRQSSAYISDPFRSRSLGAALGLRQNLNFAQTKAQVEQARAELNEVRYQAVAARELVGFDVEQTYRQVTIARSRMQTRERSRSIAGEWVRTEQINFDLGFGSAQNLIDAVQAQLELEVGYLESVRGYNTAVLRLLNAAGLLVNHVQSGSLTGE